MKTKNLLALLLAVSIILTTGPFDIFIDTFAGLSPYDSDYGKGTYSDPADYREIHSKVFEGKLAVVPTAKFSVVNKADNSIIGTSSNGDTVTIVENIPVGTAIKISNLSTKGSGTAIDMVDFQVTKDGNQVSSVQAAPTSLNSYELALSSTGTYKFYLCVRDNTSKSKTDNWGNWSYNGPHEAIGLNYGINDKKETTGTPETAGGDDFWGLWYFAQVVVKVTKNPPKPDFTISYKGINVTDNKSNPATIDPSNKSLVLQDMSQSFSAAEPITGRKWYYWDISSGWTTIAGSDNKTTVNIADMDTTLDGSGVNKAFKLVCTSNTGAEAFMEHTAYFVPALPPPPPGKADIFVYYRDKATGIDVSPPNLTEYIGKSYGTYSIPARTITGYTLDASTPSPKSVTVDAANDSVIVTFYYNSQGGGTPGNEPPNARIKAPAWKYAGEEFTVDGRDSSDKDGEIIQYIWDTGDAIIDSNSGNRMRIWYEEPSSRETIDLTVVDDGGDSDSTGHEIEIREPVPTVVLKVSGTFKENRKVVLDAQDCYSPEHYPINSKLWTINNAADIKAKAALNGNLYNEVLFKAARTYNPKITVKNTYGLSASDQKNVTIMQDKSPTANFSSTVKLLREPDESNIATITVSNLTTSPDSDPIKKTVMFYCYDSDNDGNFDEEIWKYSANGTTWQNVGLSYASIKTGFDIYNIAGGNPLNFVVKTNQAGKYKFEAMTIEDIPAAATIPELLSPSDYKRGDTFSSKPNSEKIIDVINTAPQITFEAKKKKEVDIIIATDYTGQKLANLQGALNVQKATLLAKNIDVKYTFVGQTPVAHINDVMNTYRRYGHYYYVADYYDSNDGTDFGEQFESSVLWEEKQALASEYYYLPARNPQNVSFTKSGIYSDFNSEGNGQKNYNVTIRASNDYISSSNLIKVVTQIVRTYQEQMLKNIREERASVDRTWLFGEKVSDVVTEIQSTNFDSLGSTPLRANSDRYMMFINDSNSKQFSTGWGSCFPFGGLTKETNSYIKTNNINPYIVSPQSTLDTTLGPDKASKMFSGDVIYFKSIDGTWRIIIDSSPPADINIGEVKEVYDRFVLLTDNTLKYRLDGANYITLTTGVTKVFQNKNGNGEVEPSDNLWVATSDGKLRQFKKDGVAGYVLSYPDVVDVFTDNFPEIAEGYFISCTSGTYFLNMDGVSKKLSAAPLSGYLYDWTHKWNEYSKTAHTYTFLYKNGVTQIGVVNLGTYHDEDGDSRDYVESIDFKTLYLGTYNSDEENYFFSALPKLTPIKGMKYIYNGVIREIEETLYDYSGSFTYFITMKNNDGEDANVAEVLDNDIRKYTDGTYSAPCVWQTRYYDRGYKYVSHKDRIKLPELTGKTIAKSIVKANLSLILTTDGGLYRWKGNAYYEGSTKPDFDFVLVRSNVSNIFAITYNTSNTTTQYNVTYFYYVYDGKLINEETGAVIYNNVEDSAFDKGSNRLFILTKDGKLYGEGYFGRKNSNGMYQVGDPLHELIKTPVVMNDTTKQYTDLRDILNSIPSTKYFSAGKYVAALQDITNIYLNDTSYITNYILVNDEVSYTTAYSDYENDIKFAEEWKFLHEPYWFDNSMGLASFHGQTLASPVIKYTKKGRYTINLRARDNPKNDLRFRNDTNEAYNYYQWSTGNQNVLLYVHEKPIALARAAITKNGNAIYTVKAMDAGSYDPDHSNSRADKGIAAREWRWREAASNVWTDGQMNKTDCTADESYVIQLRVKDIEGVWSDYYTITIDKDNPPVAIFSLDKTLLNINDPLKVRDQSFPQSFSTITNWHWVVKKLNTDGTAPGTNLQSAIFTTSNAGTEALAGFDSNVKTNYAANGVGSYRVYLRVKDSNGLWSDGGTNSTMPADLSKYYSMDFNVDKAPTASFTVAKSVIRTDELLKLKDTSTTAGISGIARWHWVIKKLNADGTVPTTYIQNEIHTNSNTGTDALSGYDCNVKHDYKEQGTGKYRIYLRACNSNGMWSDGGTDAAFNLGGFFYRDVVVDAPPTASFAIETNPIEPSEALKLKDTSVAVGVSPLDRWHWIIKKLNPDDSEPAGDLLNSEYPTHNAGTGILKGYESNIITDYSELGPGTYRIYLRVRNANGMWSDGFFQRDLIVRESFKICNFRVVKVRDLHLEDFYYNPTTGQYDDRLMDVNSMAVDRNNFSGMVEGLTKGYSFEFEIDTVNFNGSGDEIIINPHFYTCDSSGRDDEERELYWENSDHEILKAGQGGHAAWDEIRLGGESRSIKDGNKATWRGSYLIPGTAWAAPKGTTADNAVLKRLSKDIIVSFDIKGYKDGTMKFDYNLRQWPLERVHSKWHYEIGDVIRYDHTKCNLDDNKVILNRP